MKIKITARDGVEQTQHINPRNLEKMKKKYPMLHVTVGDSND